MKTLDGNWQWLNKDKHYSQWLFYHTIQDKHYTVWEMVPYLLGFNI